jgi:hypothetical protein
MGSQLEGFIGMMCVGVVAALVAALVLATESQIALAGLAYIGTHFLAAGILFVSFAYVSEWAEYDPPPRLVLLWSMLLLVAIPAIISLALTIGYYWPEPTSRLTTVAVTFGAFASTLVLLGIGASAIESWSTRKERNRKKR